MDSEEYIWFEVNLFVGHEIDFESNLPYSRMDGERRRVIVYRE